MQVRRDLLVASLTAALTLTAAGQTPGFQGLGQMPGSTFAWGTYSSGISGDGSTIMGYGWVCAGGYQILGSPSNCDFFGAGAISYDGSAVAGEHPIGNASRLEAFRWTAATGLKQLPMNIASAITADGKMVAGGDNWWMTSGQAGIFGPFSGEQDQTEAFGLSGTVESPVAVGAAIKGSGAQGATYHAFRWTPAGGLQDLGVGDGTQSYATAISADGQVVVGRPSMRSD